MYRRNAERKPLNGSWIVALRHQSKFRHRAMGAARLYFISAQRDCSAMIGN